MKQQLIHAQSWEERYRLIIQAGRQLPCPTDDQLAQMPLIEGCEAKLWFQVKAQTDRTLHILAYSEARIINGLLWILLQELKHKTLEEIRHFHITDYFTELGIAQRLSNTRLNGFKQIEQRLHQLEGINER